MYQGRSRLIDSLLVLRVRNSFMLAYLFKDGGVALSRELVGGCEERCANT